MVTSKELDPLGQMRHIYDRLCLPGFDLFAPLSSRYLERPRGTSFKQVIAWNNRS